MNDKAEAGKRKGHCPKCGPERYADVEGEFSKRDESEDGYIWLNTICRILVCRGCGEVYFQKTTAFSEHIETREHPITGEWEQYLPEQISYWPAPAKREQPEWLVEVGAIDSGLGELLSDLYAALDTDLRVPAAIAARTVFDRASEILGVDPAISFAEKLGTLEDDGKIGENEKDVLAVLTDAGSAAAHRGWRPGLGELDTMMSIVESFLHRSLILDGEADKLRQKIPPKPQRQAKAASKKQAKSAGN